MKTFFLSTVLFCSAVPAFAQTEKLECDYGLDVVSSDGLGVRLTLAHSAVGRTETWQFSDPVTAQQILVWNNGSGVSVQFKRDGKVLRSASLPWASFSMENAQLDIVNNGELARLGYERDINSKVMEQSLWCAIKQAE